VSRIALITAVHVACITASLATAVKAFADTSAKILWIHADGGWDTTMVFDNKIGVTGVAQESGAVAATGAGGITFVDHPSRPAVRSFFDNQGGRAAIVNGIRTGSMSHEMATRRMLGGANAGRFTDWLSWYVSNVPVSREFPHISIDAPYMPGALAANSLRLTSETIAARLAGLPSAATALPTAAEDAITKHLALSWAEVTRASTTNGIDGEKSRAIITSVTKDSKLTTALANANTATFNAADSQLLRHGKLVVELMKNNLVQAATIQAGPRRMFDTHSGNFNGQTSALNNLFAGLNGIISAATTAGISSNLIIIVTSDLGRAPQLNSNGGKEHWPWTSALIWGTGVRGGRVLGETDAALRGLLIDPIFGDIGGTQGVQLEMGNIMGALFLKQGIIARSIIGDLKPLSALVGDTGNGGAP